MLLAQHQREKYWGNIAALSPGPSVIFTDRGKKDGEAFVGREEFARILKDAGMTEAEARDEYLAVLHLVSVARDVPAFYTTANNEARRQTVEEAAALDDATLGAWTGHRDLVIIPNVRVNEAGETKACSFDQKVDQVFQAVCQILNLPVPSWGEKRYTLNRNWKAQWNFPAAINSQILETVELVSPEGIERRVRQSSPTTLSATGNLYVYSEKRQAGDGGRMKAEHLLSAREYDDLKKQADPKYQVVKKTRHSFVWKDQYFHIDEPENPNDTAVLEVTQTGVTQAVILPPGIPVYKEVTGDPTWTARARAKMAGRRP